MSVEEVEAIAGRDLTELMMPSGSHLISRGSKDLWLIIGDEGLESIRLVSIDGWRIMATRSSPVYDLCSGELFFLVRIRWLEYLVDATVFINGREATDADWVGHLLKLPVGEHEIRFEKPGYAPVVRNLDLDEDDRGDQQLYLGAPRTDNP